MTKDSKTIPLLILGKSLAFFGITAFWLLFLSQKGMTLLEIGLLESIFHGTSLLSEVPSGMLADRFSYKTNLYLSRLTTIISAVLMLLGQGNFWIYALGMIFSAWSYNFDSGTSQAFLYETAKEAGQEDSYLKLTARLSVFLEASQALGLVLAGFLVHGLLDLTYYIQIGLSLVVMVLISQMAEPRFKAEKEKRTSTRNLVRQVVKLMKQKPQLLTWILLSQSVLVVAAMFSYYYQSQIEVLTSWQISLVMLVSTGLNIGAVHLASRLGQRLSGLKLMPYWIGLVVLPMVWQSWVRSGSSPSSTC